LISIEKPFAKLFAHLKRILKLDRLRLRGPNGARDEFLLAATAQNLRKLAKLIPAPNLQPARRPIGRAIAELAAHLLAPLRFAVALLQQNLPIAIVCCSEYSPRRHGETWTGPASS
jgi:hypothetical protein